MYEYIVHEEAFCFFTKPELFCLLEAKAMTM